MQQVMAVGKIAVVLFLKQFSHQHIPHWGLHTGKGLCTLGKCFQEGKRDGTVPGNDVDVCSNI